LYLRKKKGVDILRQVGVFVLNLARKEMSKKMSKMSKEKKDSLQITRYVLDKMWDDKINLFGWLSMLGELGDEEVSDYGMSNNQLNGMRVIMHG
jgi:hypothetical protein